MFLFQRKTALAVIALENLDKLDSPLGESRGGRAMFSFQQKIALAVIALENLDKLDSPLGTCWRSRNQEVPCESLVVKRSLTFLLQRKYPRGAGAGSSLQKKHIC